MFNPKPNNLDRRFRIYRETLSRFSCAASVETKKCESLKRIYYTFSARILLFNFLYDNDVV
ncbi:hypothetical protein ACTMNS_03965 [Staphylococcus haemolyticus]